MQTISLVRQEYIDYDYTEEWANTFEIADSVADPETLFRDTIKAYLATEEGKAHLAQKDGVFTWCDAMQLIPKEYFVAHGIFPCDFKITEIHVGQNEDLFWNFIPRQKNESDEDDCLPF